MSSIRLPQARKERLEPRQTQLFSFQSYKKKIKTTQVEPQLYEPQDTNVGHLARDSFNMENTYINRMRRVAKNARATDKDRQAAQAAVNAFEAALIKPLDVLPVAETFPKSGFSSTASASWSAFNGREKMLIGLHNAGLMRRQVGPLEHG